MAQTGFTPIQLYRTTTAAAVPSAADLAPGELAINIANTDMALFAENASGSVVRLMNNPAGLRYPTADGTNGQVVTTNGSGVLSFTTPAAAGVTSVDVSGGTTGLTTSGGPVTGSGTITLGGTLGVANGGTGATTAGAALTALGAVAKAGDTMTGALAVVAGTVSAPGLAASGDSNTGIFFPAADTIAFTEGGVEALRITSTGATNVIGRLNLSSDYKENWVAANTGTAYTIDIAAGTLQDLALTGNCTFTFPAGVVAGRSFTLLLSQDGTGGRTVTWPAAVRWPGGTAPTITSTANRTDKFIFTQDGLGRWLGSNAGQNYSV